MEKETRKSFIWNIIKFIIWAVLLSISFVYLQNHPAEKVSVMSWFEVMYQRFQIFVHKVVGWDNELLKKKYSLEKYYSELIRMANNQKCIDPRIVKDINEKYSELKDSSLKDLGGDLGEYVRLAYKYDTIVKQWCE